MPRIRRAKITALRPNKSPWHVDCSTYTMKKSVICLTLVTILLPVGRADDDSWSSARLIDVATRYARRIVTTGDSESTAERARATIEFVAAPLDTRLALPPCAEQPALRLDVQNPQTGRVLVNVHCSTPNDWTVPIALTVHTEAVVYVLARPVGVGEGLEGTALRIERRKLPGLPDTLLRPPLALDPFVTRRSLPAGEPLRRQDLLPRPWIKRGDLVTLVARAAGLEVRSAAIALADARPGELVRLRHPITGRSMQAQASGPGTALALRGSD
jgi:flagella basal body P-ring formation protein FlgA